MSTCKTSSYNNINYRLVMNSNIIESGITSNCESTSEIITNIVAPFTSESGIVLIFEYNF
jgi:hypothetical protein